ncbi:MAG: PHP domain-containing protein [Candidatus Omnitrophota bacterium]
MMSKSADLHIHSFYSDSNLTVNEIFQKAREQALTCISITDHDTTVALEEAKNLSIEYEIELIDGIELSAQQQDFEIHVLGYMLDYRSAALQNALSNITDIRIERLVEMSGKLNGLGFGVDKDELFRDIKGLIPTRLHLAQYMIKKKYVSSVREAFRKYLSYGKPAYVSKFRYSTKEAIRMIKQAGGLAFLAHPHYLSDRQWIKEFVNYGIDGLEVIYPNYSQEIIAFFSKLADKYGILKSGGSDCHGSYKEFTSIGCVDVPYQWVEDIKNAPRSYIHAENIPIGKEG